MKIGIAGPVGTESIRHLLTGDAHAIPDGYAGAPLMGTLIEALLRLGHEVSAYTTDRSLSAKLDSPIIARGDRLTVYYCPSRRWGTLPNGLLQPGRVFDFFRTERRYLAQAIRHDAPDVVHAHWSYEFALAALASGRPCVVTCHDSPRDVLRFAPSIYVLGRYMMARRVLSLASHLTAVSEYVRDAVSGYASAPVSVVPNPLPYSVFRAALSEWAVGDLSRPPRLAMVLGYWNRLKNPVPAIKAFREFRRLKPGATLHLYGREYGEGGRAERALARHGTDGISFHGALDHTKLLSEIQGIDVLVHPSLIESLPMAVAEAMALGKPVVAGIASGGVPWLLDYGNAGVLVDVRDSNAILEGLLEITSNADRYRVCARAARDRALGMLRPDAVAAAYSKTYDLACAN